MLDLKLITENPEKVRQGLQSRTGGEVSSELAEVEALNVRRRALQKEYDDLRFQQNQISDEIALAKKEKRPADEFFLKTKAMSERGKALAESMTDIQQKMEAILLRIPNLPHASVPVGAGPEDNVEIRRWGDEIKISQASRKYKDHWEVGEALKILDFERATKISGARFTVYRSTGAALERALISFMLDVHTRDRGYTEILPPYMVNDRSLLSTGQLPKFEEDLFKTTTGHYLIPTAEVPVTNLHRDEILTVEELPISYAAFSPCFRSEAGASGKDTRGLIRQHQFHKVELVKFTKPEDSHAELEKLTSDAEEILKRLKLPYRVLALCTGDMGFSSAKTYDIEVWFPAQGVYREISSCSNFEDFQARRANIRFRRSPQDKKSKPEFVHTLNGSGLAVGRTLAAVLENYQQEDGSVVIPEVLKSYLNLDRIAS